MPVTFHTSEYLLVIDFDNPWGNAPVEVDDIALENARIANKKAALKKAWGKAVRAVLMESDVKDFKERARHAATRKAFMAWAPSVPFCFSRLPWR